MCTCFVVLVRVCIGCVYLFMFYLLFLYMVFFFFFKQKTAYEMRISDWSSDVCSSDLEDFAARTARPRVAHRPEIVARRDADDALFGQARDLLPQVERFVVSVIAGRGQSFGREAPGLGDQRPRMEIGRASCRERVCQYV